MTVGALGRTSNGDRRGESGSPMARIEARLQRIEAMLGRLDEVATQAPSALAVGSDIVDEWARHDGRFDERLQAALTLVDRISRPEVLSALNVMVAQIEAAPGLLGMLGDIVDETAREIESDGADLHDLTANSMSRIRTIATLMARPEMDAFIRSVASSTSMLPVMSAGVRSLAAAYEEENRVGLFGAMGKMRDPEVQRAMGFVFAMAKELGRSLEETSNE